MTHQHNTTLVTAFFDIGRERFAKTPRSTSEYLGYFDRWARIKNHCHYLLWRRTHETQQGFPATIQKETQAFPSVAFQSFSQEKTQQRPFITL